MARGIVAESVVHVDYHQFYLLDPAATPPAPGPPQNGLISTAPGIAVIYTGASSGTVFVSVEIRSEAPAVLNGDGWDEIIETSLEVPGGLLRVAALMAERPDLPILTPRGPGNYRLRIHARGRDSDPDAVAFDPLEFYHVTIWPAESAPEVTHRQCDRYGASLRFAAGTRP